MGQGFESRDFTRIERGALGLAIAALVLVALLGCVVALLLFGGPVVGGLAQLVIVFWLFVLGFLLNLWSGSPEPTTVRANRQGLWIGGEFLPSASLGEARLLRRGDGVVVRVTRRGLHLPVDLGARDAAHGERLVRALDLGAAGRDDVTIGADGILVKSSGSRRYVHHGHVERVSMADPALGPDQLELVLRGGERVLLPCRAGRGAPALLQIEQAMAACAGAEAEPEAPLLHRGDRDFRGWIARIRAVGQGVNAAHRVAPIPPDRLWHIVESPGARPAIRAAAAVALGPRLDARDRERLRLAASATTAPRLRVALEAAASATREDELPALLAEVEEEDAPPRRA